MPGVGGNEDAVPTEGMAKSSFAKPRDGASDKSISGGEDASHSVRTVV